MQQLRPAAISASILTFAGKGIQNIRKIAPTRRARQDQREYHRHRTMKVLGGFGDGSGTLFESGWALDLLFWWQLRFIPRNTPIYVPEKGVGTAIVAAHQDQGITIQDFRQVSQFGVSSALPLRVRTERASSHAESQRDFGSAAR